MLCHFISFSLLFFFFFFFSSRRRHTRWTGDWSSDVCSSDLLLALGREDEARDWFARAAAVDEELETDASERLAELDGISFTDLLEGEDEDLDEGQDRS